MEYINSMAAYSLVLVTSLRWSTRKRGSNSAEIGVLFLISAYMEQVEFDSLL